MHNPTFDPKKHLKICLRLAEILDGIVSENAGRVSGEEFRVGAGGDITYEVDVPMEEAVKQYFADLNMPVRVMTEDLGVLDFGENPEATYLIDPLDGSRNARRNLPVYACSIAVYPPNPQRLDDAGVGVIQRFDKKEIYVAVKNEGATLNNTKISASTKKDLVNAVVAVGSHFSSSYGVHQRIMKWLSHEKKDAASDVWVKTYGSTAMELAFLASGRIDFIVELRAASSVSFTPKTYDVAAGILLAREAGAHIIYGSRSLPEKIVLDLTTPVQFIGAGTQELLDKLRWMIELK